MIDIAFCELLEYKITAALQNSPDDSVKSYWCDGVLLPALECEYSRKQVNNSGQIILTAFIGTDGQTNMRCNCCLGKKPCANFREA